MTVELNINNDTLNHPQPLCKYDIRYTYISMQHQQTRNVNISIHICNMKISSYVHTYVT